MPVRIPSYSLYGDAVVPPWIDLVHIEQIHERSSLFDYEIKPHVHQGQIQILYLTSGGGDIFVDDRKWTVRAPAVLVIPSRHVHSFHFTRDVDGPVVTAAQHPLESIATVAAPGSLRYIREPRAINVGDAPRLVEALLPLFEAIRRDKRSSAKGEATAAPLLLVAIFVQVGRIVASMQLDESQAGTERSRKAARVEQFRTKVDQEFRNRWPVGRYAQELGISVGQLSRICREMLGISAQDVLNERIVHEAERELVYSTQTIKQVAEQVGFDDTAYFGRFFRKQTGLTPSDFRESARRQLSPKDGAEEG